MASNAKDPAAVELGRRGGKKGGRARAAAMTPDERREASRRAAEARWSVTKATHEGVLRFGSVEIACFVLEDHRRVISNRGIIGALSMARGGYKGAAGDRLARFASLKSINPHIPAELAAAISEPIKFRLPTGQAAHGYLATMLHDLCAAVLRARMMGTLNSQQEHIAARAEALIVAFAKVGIVALVDEATGYQRDRQRDELHRILEAYVAEELLPWAKRFPDRFYDEIFRLHEWDRRSGSQMPPYVGKLTNRLVYEQLPEGVLDELRTRNPVGERGRRRHRHHQFLTEDLGNPHLDRQIVEVTALMKGASTWEEFEASFVRAFGPQQRPLPPVDPRQIGFSFE